MANFVLRLSISEGELEQFLRDFDRRTQNLTPLNKRLGEFLVGKTDDRFRTETDPEGNPWQDLQPKTWKRKQRGGGILKILQERGRLRDTITYEADRQGVSVGSILPYAAIHQFGGTVRQYARSSYVPFKIDRDGRSRFAKRRNATFEQRVTFRERQFTIPPRPYLGLSDAYLEEMAELVGDYILNG